MDSHATPAGTKGYFEKIPVPPTKLRHFDGLTVSALGAGTYLGTADDAVDEQYLKSLVQAGLGGVNFFDTAIHYRGERSERILGKALQQLEANGFPRESFVIGTKGGYFPYAGPSDHLEEYIRTRYLDTGMIASDEIADSCHCMSPRFLENQIEASLKNLKIDCIDQYYIHNPEVELAVVGEEIFYKRLTSAFELFEKMVAEKKIARYGLATWNGFRLKKGGLQLFKAIQCARHAGGDSHHFKAIQVPLNLVMLEAIKIKNQLFGKEKKTIVEAAADYGITLFSSSPMMQGQVALLCSRVFELLPKEASRMVASLQFVLSAPRICTAFAGMREVSHWEENQKALHIAAWSLTDWNAACLRLGLE